MTTGDDVIARLNLVFNDAANARFSAAQKLGAVNAAIGAAWPTVWTATSDETITISSTTYSYTPAATPEGGFRLAYVTFPNLPDTLLRRVGQRQTDSNAWEIILPVDTALNWHGRTLKLWYVTRCAELDASTNTVDEALPLDYLWHYAAQFLADVALVKEASFETSPYSPLSVKWAGQAQQALTKAGAALRPLPQMIHPYTDSVAFNDPGLNRYGPWLVNP